jgi:hypothetical protein
MRGFDYSIRKRLCQYVGHFFQGTQRIDIKKGIRFSPDALYFIHTSAFNPLMTR